MCEASGDELARVNRSGLPVDCGPRPMEVRMARTTRRTVLQTAALSPLLAAPFVRGAHAAGKLSVGFWDHWVPGANLPLEKLCHEWADKEKVDIKVDFITS